MSKAKAKLLKMKQKAWHKFIWSTDKFASEDYSLYLFLAIEYDLYEPWSN